MWYKQEDTATEDVVATNAMLKINGKWKLGCLLDKDGNRLALPYQVRKGDKYFIEVADG